MIQLRLHRRTAILILAALLATVGLAVSSFLISLSGRAAAGEATEGAGAASEISWLVDSGIEPGGGEFGPGESVDRQQAASWLANYNEAVALVTSTEDPEGNSEFTGFATCPVGRRPVAGGGGTDQAELFMTDSRPSGPTEWSVHWETYNDFLVDPGEISVWALCVPNTIP